MGRISSQPTVVPISRATTNSPWYQAIVNSLSGRKTYIVAGAMIVYALLGIYLKYMQSTDAITLVLQALGLMGLRLGIAAQGS